MTSPIVINVPTRALLAGETKGSFDRWLANLNIKRNLTSMFVNIYLPYKNTEAEMSSIFKHMLRNVPEAEIFFRIRFYMLKICKMQ